MKRVMYISTVARPLGHEEVRTIAQTASRNNKKLGVTGVLLAAHEFFFQILEGEADVIDGLIERIRRDPRHRDLLILRAEVDVPGRLFPNWSMRTVRLEEANSMILQAVRIMLENITQSHRIIERYTQPAVLRFLMEGINPLGIPARKAQRIIIFGDMVGFSLLSQRFPVEEVTALVNLFLDTCSRRVVEFGGEVSKFIGDCVVAQFPASAADAAIDACLGILEDVHALRADARGCRLQRFLYCGFGVSAGEVIEGNIGSSIKMDYTVLGDSVNLAARLEALTRVIGRAIAISEPVCRQAAASRPFLDIGQFTLKGQDRPCPVFSLEAPVVADFVDIDDLDRAIATGEDLGSTP